VSVYLDDGDVVIHLGDCVETMAAMGAESVDAVVCDPPYGIGFMGKEWDGKAIADAAARDRETRRSLGPESASRPGRAAPRSSSAYGNPAIIAGPVRGGRDFQSWCETWATEALRVLKPGGHLLAFGGTRTFHRLTCAIEDAGFEVRDCLSWLYGSGFPKSLDVSKAIDKAAGAERGVNPDTRNGPNTNPATKGEPYMGRGAPILAEVDAGPVTPEAATWQGWGTALKPAWEPIVLARKPLGGTVAANVLAHGTGALNVDGCRVVGEAGDAPMQWSEPRGGIWSTDPNARGQLQENPAGRWPANVVLDDEAAARLDGEVGESSSSTGTVRQGGRQGFGEDSRPPREGFGVGYGDTGGPSRFFLTVPADGTIKPCQTEDTSPARDTAARPTGAEPDLFTASSGNLRTDPSQRGTRSTTSTATKRTTGSTTSGSSPRQSTSGSTPSTTDAAPPESGSVDAASAENGSQRPPSTTTSVPRGGSSTDGAVPATSPASLPINEPGALRFCYAPKASTAERDGASHPTVKNLALMRWCVRLVTPPGGVVLDPFAGSGTTLLAARDEGFRAIGIEREGEYAAMAAHRLRQLSLLGGSA
jgi:DNA modification methylase